MIDSADFVSKACGRSKKLAARLPSSKYSNTISTSSYQGNFMEKIRPRGFANEYRKRIKTHKLQGHPFWREPLALLKLERIIRSRKNWRASIIEFVKRSALTVFRNALIFRYSSEFAMENPPRSIMT